MPRPSFEEIYMQLARLFAARSTCSRMQVGCVVTNDDYTMVLSVGYNGNFTGGPNCCDRHEPGNCGCIHAETNSLIKLNTKKWEKKVLFCTHLPCPMCAKLIVNKGGFTKIVYENDYRVQESKEIFKTAAIEVVQWMK